jgi:hypothetical protein
LKGAIHANKKRLSEEVLKDDQIKSEEDQGFGSTRGET